MAQNLEHNNKTSVLGEVGSPTNQPTDLQGKFDLPTKIKQIQIKTIIKKQMCVYH